MKSLYSKFFMHSLFVTLVCLQALSVSAMHNFRNPSKPDYIFNDPITGHVVNGTSCGLYELVSTGYQIDTYSELDEVLDGDASSECMQTIRQLLYKHKIANPHVWHIQRINDKGRAKTYIPYVLITNSCIFIDEGQFLALKHATDEVGMQAYDALCLYIVHHIETSAYVKTYLPQSISSGATWYTISSLIQPMISKIMFGGLSYMALDAVLLSSQNCLPKPIFWATKFCISTLVYYKIQSYVGPVIDVPFQKYIDVTLRVLDAKVVAALGDNRNGVVTLLTRFQESLKKNDHRYASFTKRIQALS